MALSRTLANFGDSLGSNALVIDSSGNVGVGTSTINTGNKLAVHGGNIQIGTSGSGLRFPDGTVQTTAAAAAVINVQTFTSSGTWTKPSGYSASSRVHVQCWGGGGSGAKSTGGAGGGGGGAYNEYWFTLSTFGATETATVAAGGNAITAVSTAGLVGGNTTFGSYITAYGGGGGGASNAGGGGGGGQMSAGGVQTAGNPILGQTETFDFRPPGQGGGSPNPYGIDGFWHGGGGASAGAGGKSVFGGGGGGASVSAGAGGTSAFGGAGGAGSATGLATSGSVPSGGGGATGSTVAGAGTASGAGAIGKIIVTVFPA